MKSLIKRITDYFNIETFENDSVVSMPNNNETFMDKEYLIHHSISDIPRLIEKIRTANDETAQFCAQRITWALLVNRSYLKGNQLMQEKLRNAYIKPADILKFGEYNEEFKSIKVCSVLYAVASVNRDGFVREPALYQLIASNHKNFFSFILLRLNDWVGSISIKAKDAVNKSINQEEYEVFIRNHKIVEQLNHARRNDLSQIYADIRKLIFSPAGIAYFNDNRSQFDIGERFYFYTNLVRLHPMDEEVQNTVLSDSNARIRLIVLKDRELTDYVLSQSLKDLNSAIRRRAIYCIAPKNAKKFDPIIRTLLMDANKHTRTKAQQLFSSYSYDNLYELYESSYLEKPTIGNMMGLSETGSVKNIDAIEPMLIHKENAIRAKSLEAIANLDERIAKNYAYKKLRSSSSLVKKSCYNVIGKSFNKTDLLKFRELFPGETELSKCRMLRIMRKFGGWSIAGDILLVLQTDNLQFRNTAENYLRSWSQYSKRLGTKLTGEDKEYVMGIYSSLRKSGFNKYSYDIQSILHEIPFIFRA